MLFGLLAGAAAGAGVFLIGSAYFSAKNPHMKRSEDGFAFLFLAGYEPRFGGLTGRNASH